MEGKLAFYYTGDNPEEIILALKDFPEVVLILPKEFIHLKQFAEEQKRVVLFLDEEEIKKFLKPDYEYYVSIGGHPLEELASKIRNGFVCLVHLNNARGTPINIERKLQPRNAAVIISFELSKILRYF